MPTKLYHATYLHFLDSIKENGLGATKNKMWEDSKTGVVYLADDPWVAESYAECSEFADDELLDDIIILEVDTSKLDTSKLYVDENVKLEDDEENATWEYHGIIPWEACKIFDSNLAEAFKKCNENILFNKKDLVSNLDKFESGESNILLVTGFPGSGKTYLAAELAEKYNCNHFQLDYFTDYTFGGATKAELAEAGEYGLLAYIKLNNLKNTYTDEDFTEAEIINFIRDYIKFIISWCKNQKNQKFIIEGFQLYDVYRSGDVHVTSCPIIIKGTSSLNSTIRAAKRNSKTKDTTFKDEFKELIGMSKTDNKNLAALEKDVKSGRTFAEDFKLYESLWD